MNKPQTENRNKKKKNKLKHCTWQIEIRIVGCANEKATKCFYRLIDLRTCEHW